MELLEKAKPYMAVIFLQFGYAGSAIISKLALNHGMSHYTFSVYRNLFAAVVFTPFAVVLERKVRPKMTLSVMLKIMLLALLEPVIAQNLYYEAVKHTTATYANAMTNMLPAITFLLAWALRLEQVNIKKLPSQVKIIGTIIIMGGAMIMTLVAGPAIAFPWTRDKGKYTPIDHGSPHNKHSIIGALMVTAGCLSGTCFYILQAITVKSYPAVLSLSSLICMVGALQATVLTLVAEQHHPSVWSIGWNSILLSYVYSGMVTSGAGYYISGIIMKTKGPVFVTSFNPLSMVIIAVLSSFILREKLTYGSIFGALVIIIGLYLVIWGKNRDHKTSSSCNNGDQVNPVDQESPEIHVTKASTNQENSSTDKYVGGYTDV